MSRYDAVAIGCSAGGLAALDRILPGLPADFPAAVIILMHSAPESRNLLVELLGRRCRMPVLEATEKNPLRPGTIYVAPPAYHLLIEDDRTFSLSADEKVNYSRPSIDVLFESAAHAFRERLIGLILSGANRDGSAGLRAVADVGGLCLVQDPADAQAAFMPEAAIQSCPLARVLTLEAIAQALIETTS